MPCISLPDTLFSSRFDTSIGCGFVLATEKGVCQVILPAWPGHGQPILCAAPPNMLTRQAAQLLERYFSGTPTEFNDIAIDFTATTPFRCHILTLIRQIPYGEARSYMEVAAMAGRPTAARAVGGAMAANPIPVIVPCHRVVASDGSLTGFSASGGLIMKKYLLELEKTDFKGEKINLKK